MKYWVTCPADVEKYVRDERERPRDYEEHFYPCYIEYEEPWDYHFCGDFYFLNKSREEAIAMRRENLIAYIAKSRWQITAAKHALKELDKY
jgi:hypothetical protein